jgi:hypothetical protein
VERLRVNEALFYLLTDMLNLSNLRESYGVRLSYVTSAY